MKKLDASDIAILKTADPRLVRLLEEVNKIVPLRVLEAHRSEAKQALAVRKGNSKVLWGKHNVLPSLAVDILPETALDKNGAVRWNDRDDFTFFAGVVLGVANLLNIPIRWGGDWDRDFDTNDNSFDDLVHFELDVPLPARPAAKPAPKIKIAAAFAPDVVGIEGGDGHFESALEVPAFLQVDAEDALDLTDALPSAPVPLTQDEISELRRLLGHTAHNSFNQGGAEMADVKSIFQSKTIWGLVAAGAPVVLGLFGIKITDADATGLLAHVEQLITIAGLIYAGYGRIVATTRIS